MIRGESMRLTSRSKESGNISIVLSIQRVIRWTYGTSAKRDSKAATRFFRKVLKAQHTQKPRVITVDKNAAYPIAIEALKVDETLEATTELRQNKYLNNVIEQDHRNIKRLTKPMMGFGSFNTTRRTLSGIEAMSMIRKGQVNGISQGDRVSQAKFIEELFGISA